MDPEDFYLQRIAHMAASAAKVAYEAEVRLQKLTQENVALRTEIDELRHSNDELAVRLVGDTE